MAGGEALARGLADRVRGRAVEVPEDRVSSTWVVELEDGRAALLVRDFGHTTRVTLAREESWSDPAGDRALDEIAVKTVAWGAKTKVDALTLHDLATRLARALASAFTERWTVSFPSPPIPSEAWLHGPDFDAASVGVFPGRAGVWLGDVPSYFRATMLGELDALIAGVVDGVREQKRRYEAHRSGAAHLEHEAERLIRPLARHYPGERIEVRVTRRPTHAATPELALIARGEPIVHLEACADGASGVAVRAGLPGQDGWTGTLDDVDAAARAIALALDRKRRSLTLDDLRPGHRYRVIASAQELTAGTTVTFDAFDDVDNHYGRYVFRTSDGREVTVSGDFSSPEHSPLAEVHRILEPLAE